MRRLWEKPAASQFSMPDRIAENCMTKDVSEALGQAINDVEHAFRLLEFSIRILNYFELYKVDLELFGQDTTTLLDEENLTFNDSYFLYGDNAELAAKMAIGASFGASAIVLDDLFEATGQNRDPTSDNEFNLLWTLVYAVRNAFAHGVASPIWVVKGKNQRKIEFSVAGRKTAIDLAALDGQEFDYAHFGGVAEWFHIKDRVLAIVCP